MAWIYLILAILFEVTGTTSMKLADGFRNPIPSAAVFLCYGISISLLTLAVRSIDISVAYAIWCAIGMALIALIGILWFQESVTIWKVASLVIIGIGVVSLQLSERAAG